MSSILRNALAILTAGLATVCVAQTNPAADQTKSVIDPAKSAPQTAPSEKESNMVTIRTSKGDIQVELYPDKAPITVKNFFQYVDKKHYNGTIFHRVIDGFMIQGGGFTKDLNQKTTLSPIKNEASNGLKNDRGTLAMARTGDPDSATAQFFINVVDNKSLNRPAPDGHGYCVFGKVTQGMDVVDQIKSVPTGNQGPFQNVPTEPVEIIEITRSAK
jgi:peptidyl-prolyl cis-trans isomerase A (cyclophilin A)